MATEKGTPQTGTVYLLHFDRPLSHARHYIGFATNLERRMKEHRRGHAGAGIMRALKKAGIGFSVARTWEGDRAMERVLKKRAYAPKLCPTCSGEKAHEIKPIVPEIETYPIEQEDLDALEDIPF